MAEHNVTLELFYDGAWHPAPVRDGDPIKAMRGSKDIGNDTDPAGANATLDNSVIAYAPRSLASPLYGKIGQNTKGRLTVDGGVPLALDRFDDRSFSGAWGLTRTGPGGGWSLAWNAGSAANFSVSGGAGLMAVTAAAAYSMAYLADLHTDAPDVAVTVSAPLATGGDLETGPLLAGAGTTTYYMLRAVIKTTNAIDLKIINVVNGVETTLVTVSSGLTHAAATPLNLRGQIRGGVVRLKAWQGSVEPDAWQAEATATVVRRGWVGLRSGRGAGNTNTTAPQFSYDNLIVTAGQVRLSGEVASWKPQRPIKGSGWTDIELAGVLRRIGRGTDPIQSAAVRVTLALNPVSYWPLEAGVGALTAATAPLVPNPGRSITWADSAALAGSLPLPRVATKDEVLPTPGDGYPFPTALSGLANAVSVTEWSIGCWVIAVPHSSAPATPSVTYALQWGAAPLGAANRAWELSIASGTGWTGASEVFLNMNVNNYALRGVGEIMDGQPHHLMVTAKQTAPNQVSIVLYVDGVAYTTGSSPNPATPFTLQPVTFVYVGGEGETSGSPDQWTGHVSVFDRALTGAEVVQLYRGGLGWPGEAAADRFARFCVEEGVTPTVIGDPAESVPMGPQVPKPRLKIFEEIARTDDASIFETRDDASGLTMRTGASKLNQTPALTINYLGQIQPKLVPVFGDEGIRNDVAARDPSGASRRVQQLTGPHNVELPEDDPQGVGRYQTSIDVNPQAEDGLSDAAGWRVNLGTYDGTWFAEVTVDLDAAPGLIAAVNALDIGDVLAIANLPADEALDTVEGVIIGIEDDLPPKRRLVTFYLVPNDPYRVGIMAQTSGDTDPFLGHVDSDGSTTAATVAAGAASFTVATPSGPPWTTDADDFPFDVLVGSQRVSLSSISGASSPQTFTVRTAGFQVRYLVASGVEVKPYQPLILAL